MNSRFVLLVLLGVFVWPMAANADYIIETESVAYVESAPCIACQRPCIQKKYKKHHIKKSHVRKHRHYRRHCTYVSGSREPVCVYSYFPQAEIPAFRSGAPTGRGRYVNLVDCEPYAPDMATGDDDPMVYPGMNINN